jgi:hypothetical protein
MLSAAPAAAATSTFRAATTQAAVVAVISDPAQIAANCPAGFAERGALLLKSQFTVQVESAVYSGTMQSLSDQHCSVPRPPMSTWIDGTRTVTPIQMEAGHMVLATPVGDQLFLDYRAPGVIKGDLFGLNTHTFNGPFTITGGTGIFERATGHGALFGEVQATATGFTGGWTMQGTISAP